MIIRASYVTLLPVKKVDLRTKVADAVLMILVAAGVFAPAYADGSGGHTVGTTRGAHGVTEASSDIITGHIPRVDRGSAKSLAEGWSAVMLSDTRGRWQDGMV